MWLPRAPWLAHTLQHAPCSSQAIPQPGTLTDLVPAGEVHGAGARCQAERHWRLQLEVVQAQLQRDGAQLVVGAGHGASHAPQSGTRPSWPHLSLLTSTHHTLLFQPPGSAPPTDGYLQKSHSSVSHAFFCTSYRAASPPPNASWSSHQGLARQLQVCHRHSDLLVLVVSPNDLHHVALILGTVREAHLGRIQTSDGHTLAVSSWGRAQRPPHKLPAVQCPPSRDSCSRSCLKRCHLGCIFC